MLILFFLVACLAHGAYTVYRVLKERSEVGESDSLIGKVLPHAVLFFLLAVVAVGVGNLFDNIDKHTAAVGASFIGFLWLPRIAVEHYVLHMTHTKNEIGLAIIYAICSFIILVKF